MSPRHSPKKSVRRARAEHGYGVFPLTVSRVVRLSESFVRVSLTGPSLRWAADEIAYGRGGLRDAYVKVLVPAPGSSEPTRINLTQTWRQDWFALPETTRGWMRTYTLRASRLSTPAVGTETLPDVPDIPEMYFGDLTPAELPAGQLPEIDMDFVLHTETAPDGTERMGPGARWAAQARVGERISILAPLRGQALWASWEENGARELILAVDETAIPAALSILSDYVREARAPRETRERAPRIHLLAEVPHEHDTLQALWQGAYPRLGSLTDAGLDLCITWLVREHGSTEARGEGMLSELRRILGITRHQEDARAAQLRETAPPDELVWGVADSMSTDRYVLLAGEASLVKQLRRICVREGGVPKTDVSFMGYWRVGTTES